MIKIKLLIIIHIIFFSLINDKIELKALPYPDSVLICRIDSILKFIRNDSLYNNYLVKQFGNGNCIEVFDSIITYPISFGDYFPLYYERKEVEENYNKILNEYTEFDDKRNDFELTKINYYNKVIDKDSCKYTLIIDLIDEYIIHSYICYKGTDEYRNSYYIEYYFFFNKQNKISKIYVRRVGGIKSTIQLE